MAFTIVVPFYNGHETLGRLLDSLPRALPAIVVDDHSEAPLQLSQIERRENVTLIRPAEKGYFSGAVNTGIEACNGDVLVLNQDAWLEGDQWLDLVLLAQGNGYAIAGDGVMAHPAWPNGYVQGTFMYMSREAISRVGLLNVQDYPLWGATAEWQLRACRQGFKALPVTPIPGFHHEERKQGTKYGTAITKLLSDKPNDKALWLRTPPALSVIVPCHNYGRYLEDCINSLLGGETSLGRFAPQTFQSFEVVIVDDASTDNTREIGEGLADGWKGIRCIRSEKNIGLPNALNLGIANSFGKYITILSADDMRESWSLEDMYRIQERNAHSMVYDDLMWFGDGKRGVVATTPNGKGKQVISHYRLSDYQFENLLEKNLAHAGIMYPREAWKEVGGYPSVMRYGREDWAFNVALGIKGYCGVHIKQPGYLYRREGQGRTHTNSGFEWREHFRAQMEGLFPEVYRGGRPMGCCGGGKSRAGTRSSNGVVRGLAMATMEPVEGMELLQYEGGNVGKSPYYGFVTGRVYEFGANDKYRQRYVDVRDVGEAGKNGFLNIMEGRKAAFSVVPTQPKAKQQEPALATSSSSITTASSESTGNLFFERSMTTGDFEPVEITSGPESIAIAVDPGEMTLVELSSYIVGLSKEQLAGLLDAEKAGKARKGAISLLEEALY